MRRRKSDCGRAEGTVTGKKVKVSFTFSILIVISLVAINSKIRLRKINSPNHPVVFPSKYANESREYAHSSDHKSIRASGVHLSLSDRG